MEIQVIRKKIKNAYIQIKDGKVFVRVPYQMSKKQVQELIEQKRIWMEQQLQKQIVNKQIVTILGKQYPIITIPSEEEKVEFTTNQVKLYSNSKEKEQKLLQELYQKEAQRQYIITTQKMMEKTGLKPEVWRIRNIKSAWGSCSSKKAITLSLQLIQKREEVIEYVVLHELCHLKHMNHSKAFWNLVENYMPEYKKYRKELKG